MLKANRGGWKACARGHKYRGADPCPICWPGGAKKRKKKLEQVKRLSSNRINSVQLLTQD